MNSSESSLLIFLCMVISMVLLIVAIFLLLGVRKSLRGEGQREFLRDSFERSERSLKESFERSERSLKDSESDIKADIGRSGQETARLLTESRQETINALLTSRTETTAALERSRVDTTGALEKSRSETIEVLEKSRIETAEALAASRKETMEALDRSRTETLATVRDHMNKMAMENEQKLSDIRETMERRIAALTEDNAHQLEKMRETVDEKLQKTLEDRLTKSFSLVSERLEEVYKGLGEMQGLAAGVGDLKKVLSNVKTRGILGEVQLGAILGQILSPEQYEENIATRPNSSERVEFAVKLPGDEGAAVYLPIDAKFPGDTYIRLCDAIEAGDKAGIDFASKELVQRIKSEAKDIHNKYVEPPYTTDFAILFLPTEGLYAEAVRLGLVEVLQREYKVNIAGPTTMAALLNSLQMGFKTLAIQKHSGEVWEVLGAVKTEFETFGKVLESTRNRLRQADEDLDKLIGTRTRSIQRKLRNVEALPESESRELIEAISE